MTLQQLRYVVAISDEGSFTAAAAALRLATPSISDQVRRLEDELGVRLFTRAGRSVGLTDAGRDLLPYARQMIETADEARRAVGDLRDVRRGLLTLGLARNADYYLLADVVEAFLAAHPGVRLRLVGQNSAEVAAAIRDGGLEAGLLVLPVEDEGLAVRPLLRDEVLFVTRENERPEAPVELAALADRPLVLYDAGFGVSDPTRRQVMARMQRHGLTLRPRVELEHIEAALPLVRRGIGVTLAASTVLERLGVRQGLVGTPFAEPLFDTLAIVTRHRSKLSRAAARFLELAEEQLREVAASHPRAKLIAASGDGVQYRE